MPSEIRGSDNFDSATSLAHMATDTLAYEVASTSSWADTGLSVTITPKAVGNVIIISYSHRPVNNDSGGDQGIYTGFNIGGIVVNEDIVANTGANNNYLRASNGGQYVYTATGTSTITIKLQHKYAGGATDAQWHDAATQASLVVMEIAQ
mgnify:CR=1 FL=1